MLAETKTTILESTTEGHVVVMAKGLYTIFQTALPAGQSNFYGTQWFSYGRIMAREQAENAWRLVRSNDGKLLIPGSKAPFDVEFRTHILAMPEQRVDAFVRHLGAVASIDGQQSATAAERLYQAVRKRNLQVGGAAIEACATYDLQEDSARLVIVDESGGYSIGVPPSEGIARDSDLLPQDVHAAVSTLR